MASNRLAKNVTEDYLTCTICLQRYRDPHALPCEHTFCLSCLANHIQGTRVGHVIVCPIDKGEISLPAEVSDPWEAARGFPQDELITNLLKVVEETRNHRARTDDQGEPLDFFCFGCKVLTSAEVAVANHRGEHCECLKIQKAYQRILPKVNEYGHEIEKLLIKSKRIRQEKMRNRGNSESQQEVLSQIDVFESRLDEFYLDTKQQIRQLKADVVHSQQEPEVSDEVDEVFENASEMYNTFNEAVDNENAAEVLEGMSTIGDKISNLRLKMDGLPKRRTRRCSFDFIPDPRLVEVLHTRPNLGTLHSITSTSFHARDSSDDEDFNIYDAAITKDYVILADGERGVVDRFHQDGTLVDYVSLSNPCRIAILNDEDMVITRYFKKKMTIISLGRKMQVRENVRTKRSYVGVCELSNGNLCVSFYDGIGSSGLDIITRDGKILKTLLGNHSEPGNQSLFSVPMFVTSTRSDKIVVCDYSNTHSILCFNDNLELVWRHSMTHMPCGVASDGASTLYVSIPSEHRVIALFAENGEKLRNVVKATDGVTRPYAVKFCDRKLVVTEDETDKIHVLNL